MSCLQSVAALFANPIRSQSRILIEPEVLNGLRAFRQASADDEAGGILLGYHRPPHLHIVEYTAPAAGDKRSRYQFDRCDPFHRDYAIRRWKASRNKLDCLGEWHTHPETDPRPSGIDTAEWLRVLSETRRTRIFIIVGLRRDWIGIGSGKRLSEAVTAESESGFAEGRHER